MMPDDNEILSTNDGKQVSWWIVLVVPGFISSITSGMAVLQQGMDYSTFCALRIAEFLKKDPTFAQPTGWKLPAGWTALPSTYTPNTTPTPALPGQYLEPITEPGDADTRTVTGFGLKPEYQSYLQVKIRIDWTVEIPAIDYEQAQLETLREIARKVT